MKQIPSTWAMAPIGDLCDLKNGRAFKPIEWTSEGLPIVRIQNLNNKNAQFNYYSGAYEDKYYLKGGELLFAWSGTPGTSFGAHEWRGGEALLNQHIFRVDFDKNFLDRRLFRHAINQQLSLLISKAHGGAGLQHVTKGKFEATEIAVPPLNEQRRIADKLDTTLARVDTLNDRLARITPLLKRFRQSVLAAATSGRLTEDWRAKNGIPCEWKYSKISDRCTLKSGKSYSIEYEQELGDFLYIKVSDMNIEGNSFVIEKSSRYISASVINERELIPVRSVIFPKRGGAIATNKKSLVLHKPIICDLNIMSINIPLDINEFFFYFWFKTIDLASLNNGSTIPQVNNVDINPLVFPEPSLEEQTEIVRRVETLFAFADRLEARLQSAQTAAERLTPALLAKAFRGELVPQDPNDEPATELLRRLREARAADTASKPKRGRAAKAPTVSE